MLATALWVGIAATLGFELLTCLGRFVLRLRSREITVRYTRGVRIHHGFVGAAMAPPSFLITADPVSQAIVLGLATGLVASDLLHHFVVLPLATGQFD